MTTNRRYLPPKVKADLARRPQGVLSLPAEKCPRCGDPLPEAKYHDCGEQLSILDVIEDGAA